MFKPYAKGWAIYRKDKISKVKKAPLVKKFEDELNQYNLDAIHTVSYTHLTLPTILRV